MFRRQVTLTVLCIALSGISGCSDGRPERFQVQGVVQVDGEPLTGDYAGYVRLIPEHNGRPASGELDPATGKFTLGNYEESDGCPRGTFLVEITAYVVRNNQLKHVIPPRCNDCRTSGMSVVIDGETDNLVINVKSIPEDEKYQTLWEPIGF